MADQCPDPRTTPPTHPNQSSALHFFCITLFLLFIVSTPENRSQLVVVVVTFAQHFDLPYTFFADFFCRLFFADFFLQTFFADFFCRLFFALHFFCILHFFVIAKLCFCAVPFKSRRALPAGDRNTAGDAVLSSITFNFPRQNPVLSSITFFDCRRCRFIQYNFHTLTPENRSRLVVVVGTFAQHFDLPYTFFCRLFLQTFFCRLFLHQYLHFFFAFYIFL